MNEIINDLTRDQTAAQNIVNTLGVVSDITWPWHVTMFGQEGREDLLTSARVPIGQSMTLARILSMFSPKYGPRTARHSFILLKQNTRPLNLVKQLNNCGSFLVFDKWHFKLYIFIEVVLLRWNINPPVCAGRNHFRNLLHFGTIWRAGQQEAGGLVQQHLHHQQAGHRQPSRPRVRASRWGSQLQLSPQNHRVLLTRGKIIKH